MPRIDSVGLTLAKRFQADFLDHFTTAALESSEAKMFFRLRREVVWGWMISVGRLNDMPTNCTEEAPRIGNHQMAGHTCQIINYASANPENETEDFIMFRIKYPKDADYIIELGPVFNKNRAKEKWQRTHKFVGNQEAKTNWELKQFTGVDGGDFQRMTLRMTSGLLKNVAAFSKSNADLIDSLTPKVALLSPSP